MACNSDLCFRKIVTKTTQAGGEGTGGGGSFLRGIGELEQIDESAEDVCEETENHHKSARELNQQHLGLPRKREMASTRRVMRKQSLQFLARLRVVDDRFRV